MSLSNATSKLKTETENEFSSRTEYMAQKEKERAEREDISRKFTQFEPQRENNKERDRRDEEKPLKEISASLKTIQSILKGISTNSEKHLRAISKKLDNRKSESVETRNAPTTIVQTVAAGSPKDKVLLARNMLATAKWQNDVIDLLKKILHKRGGGTVRRTRSAPKRDGGGILSGILKAIGAVLLGAGASGFISGLAKSIGLTVKDVLKGVGNAILDVGKIAIVAVANGIGSVLGKIATMIKGIAESVADFAKNAASKLYNAATEFLSNMGKKGVDLAKKGAKYVTDTAKDAGKAVVNAGKNAVKTYALPAAKEISKVALGVTGAVLAAKGAKKLATGVGKAVTKKMPEIAKKVGSGVKAGASATKKMVKGVAKAAKTSSMYGGAAWDTAKDIAKESRVGKAVAKLGTKAGTKTIFKTILKKMPLGIGAAVGLGYAANRALHGDYSGAGIEAGSAVASIVPGAGTAASIVGEGALIKHDMDLEKRLQARKPVVAPITHQLESSQKRNEEVKALKDQRRTQAPEPQPSVTTNNVQGNASEVAPRIGSRNHDTTMDFFRKMTIFGAFSGHGHVVG